MYSTAPGVLIHVYEAVSDRSHMALHMYGAVSDRSRMALHMYGAVSDRSPMALHMYGAVSDRSRMTLHKVLVSVALLRLICTYCRGINIVGYKHL
jgi:predicted metal-dependent enzyme (double-stranded beta helix superfamily)